MKDSFSFTIQSLLEREDGNVFGPLSPLLFANESAGQMAMKFNRLARVWFDDDQILQQEGEDGLTGYDCLIIGCRYKDDLLVSLWVDQGVGGLPVAFSYQSDREILIAPIYEKSEFAKKLTESDIRQLFDYVFNYPECLAINASRNK